MRQRGVFIKEFNNPLSNIGKFDGVLKVATEHINFLAGDARTAEIPDVRHAADNFAATLWGDTLYGRSDALTYVRVMKVADEILRRAGSPWPSALYSLMLTFRHVRPGKPTPSEAKVRAEIENLYEKNVRHLEDYERSNPDLPMRTIRSLSVADGGNRTGPLTRFATQFARLNVFGRHQTCFPKPCTDRNQAAITASVQTLRGLLSNYKSDQTSSQSSSRKPSVSERLTSQR